MLNLTSLNQPEMYLYRHYRYHCIFIRTKNLYVFNKSLKLKKIEINLENRSDLLPKRRHAKIAVESLRIDFFGYFKNVKVEHHNRNNIC